MSEPDWKGLWGVVHPYIGSAASSHDLVSKLRHSTEPATDVPS